MNEQSAPIERTLPAIALSNGGAETSDGKFYFATVVEAAAVAALLGATIPLPKLFAGREAYLYQGERLQVNCDVPRRADDPAPAGWYARSKTYWAHVTSALCDQREDAERLAEIDPIIRAIAKRSGSSSTDERWLVQRRRGGWKPSASSEGARLALVHHGFKKDEIERMIAYAYCHDWEVVCEPFQPIELVGRKINLNAPQFKYQPSPGEHRTWDTVLQHCGASLDRPLQASDWARRYRIRTGGAYLLYWAASLLRATDRPLPYLFFYGPQNGGKSTYHEALDLLVTSGVKRVDRALKSETFNGELDGCILGVVEETNFEGQPAAYNRLKDWVTGLNLSIRKMHHDAVMTKNFAHFLQCSNEISACPIFAGDTRITMLFVDKPKSDIPKEALMFRLGEEAPGFMDTILKLKLPEPEGRLSIPVVETESKRRAMIQADPVAAFIAEKCELAGDIDKDILFDAFKAWCDLNNLDCGTSPEFSKELLATGQIKSKKRTPSQGRKPCFIGIKLKSAE